MKKQKHQNAEKLTTKGLIFFVSFFFFMSFIRVKILIREPQRIWAFSAEFVSVRRKEGVNLRVKYIVLH